jgi:hypothetical protein
MRRTILNLCFKWLRIAVGSAILAGAGLGLHAQASAGWRTVSTGFSAQVLLDHDNAMWAGGSAESIAVSQDGGQHWQMKHTNPTGALLLSLQFVTDKFGYAAGTGGLVLFTQDGGESWTAGTPASETIFQAAFGDANHGIIRTRSALLATTDGGKNWKPVSPANDPDWSSKYPFTDSLAALDATHLIIRVSEGEAGDGEFLWTADGGETWNANYLPNGAGSGHLFVTQGQYWAVGHEVVGKDEPGGGYATPMAVLSKDGVNWDHKPVYHDVCHWTSCGGCTPQGCFAGRSSFVPFSRILQDAHGNGSSANSEPDSVKPESLARFPEHLLSDRWARDGETLCLLTQGVIQCADLTPAATLDTKDDQAEWDTDSYPPVHPTQANALIVSIEPALGHGLRCIRCDLSRSYFSETGDSGPTQFTLSFVIGTSCRAENLSIAGALPKDVAERMREAVESWLFEPHTENGVVKPFAVKLSGKVFVMNFQKPPRQ